MESKWLKRLIIISFIGMVLIWSFTYYQNSSLDKVIKGKNIIEVVYVSKNARLVLQGTGDKIKGESYSKGVLGWRLRGTSSPAVKNRDKDTVFRLDNLSVISVNGNGYLYSYANPFKIKQIKFQEGSHEVRVKIDSSYWYLPMLRSEMSFKAEQLSVVLKDGSEDFYPFEELH